MESKTNHTIVCVCVCVCVQKLHISIAYICYMLICSLCLYTYNVIFVVILNGKLDI